MRFINAGGGVRVLTPTIANTYGTEAHLRSKQEDGITVNVLVGTYVLDHISDDMGRKAGVETHHAIYARLSKFAKFDTA